MGVLEGEGAEHVFTDAIAAATIIVLRDVMRELRFASARYAGRNLLARASENGWRIYSADRFNYLAARGASEVLSDGDGSDQARRGRRRGWISAA